MKFGDKKIPAALGLVLPMLLRLFGFKTVVLLHNILEQVDLESAGFTSNKFAQKVYNFIGTTLTRCVLKSNKVAVTISKYVTVLEQKYKVNNVIQIPHGTFESIKDVNFELPSGAKKVMAFGKFGTYKKVEILIEAIELIRKTYTAPIEIVIAGTDSPNTPGYLDAVAQKYKNVEGLIFTGYVAESDVERIFTESTVVVFPYTSTTGSSGVLHQAGSYGKAVVMPNLGDLSILIKDEGYAGAFFEPEDTASLALAIGSILHDDEYRKTLAKTNFEAASALSMDRIVEMYLNVFKEIGVKN
jgi:glycosyltransferase involved in cell wall biosynthesis